MYRFGCFGAFRLGGGNFVQQLLGEMKPPELGEIAAEKGGEGVERDDVRPTFAADHVARCGNVDGWLVALRFGWPFDEVLSR